MANILVSGTRVANYKLSGGISFDPTNVSGSQAATGDLVSQAGNDGIGGSGVGTVGTFNVYGNYDDSAFN